MQTEETLVTGATGKTGAPVVRMLIERGIPVRAMVHRRDDRADRLEALGARVVVGDFLDLASLRGAVKGITRLYFCYPPIEGLLEATSLMAVAARDAGVETLINMSQVTAREGAPSPLSRAHWVSEQVLDWADVGAVHIQPTFFAQDLYLFTGGSVGREGTMRLPFGNGKHAPVSADDIARVVVGILADPASHRGRRYVVTGRHTMTLTAIAEEVGRGLDKSVTYIDVPIPAWRDALDRHVGFPKYLTTHLAAVAQDHRDGVLSAENDVVERIGGQPPESVEAFARAHAAMF
jgi:NAD(P)H dehydrogenase (quinone)